MRNIFKKTSEYILSLRGRTRVGVLFLLLPFTFYAQTNTFPESGNVGIGTVNPISILEVEKNFNGSTMLRISNSDDGNSARRGIFIGDGTSGSSVYLLSTSPNYNVVDSWGNAAVLGVDSQLSNGLIVRTSKGSIRFQPAGTSDKIVFAETGNVGIGTTSPGNWKLAVNGNIRAREIKVETGWSDFVFEDSYDLPNLEEVEQHIKEKGHLKDIPSAKEVEENGIFLGEMDAKLLRKIEELTLYVIELKKEIEQLKNNR